MFPPSAPPQLSKQEAKEMGLQAHEDASHQNHFGLSTGELSSQQPAQRARAQRLRYMESPPAYPLRQQISLLLHLHQALAPKLKLHDPRIKNDALDPLYVPVRHLEHPRRMVRPFQFSTHTLSLYKYPLLHMPRRRFALYIHSELISKFLSESLDLATLAFSPAHQEGPTELDVDTARCKRNISGN